MALDDGQWSPVATQHDGDYSGYELILTTAYAHSFTPEEGLPASELHFTYWVTHTWGAGAAYVAKFDDEVQQHEIPILLSANPTSWLTLNVGPNFVLPVGGEFSVGAYMPRQSLTFDPHGGSTLVRWCGSHWRGERGDDWFSPGL